MRFPVSIPLGGWSIDAHAFFEGVGYLAGVALLWFRRSRTGDTIPLASRFAVLAAAGVGAFLGGKLLFWLERPVEIVERHFDLVFLLSGKSIVGALLGGLIAVELAKRRMGIRRATGDLLAYPLCLAIAIGRIGCFLAGLSDHTCGNPTGLPFGVDFGDGFPRHPTQLYEILALSLIALVIRWKGRCRPREGDLFRIFMVLYLAWRLVIDFLKPAPGYYFGLDGIQLACVLGLVYYARHFPTLFRPGAEPMHVESPAPVSLL